MTLTELRYLVAVARERHFGRAAEACFVSQPTLSVAIKKLEQELGVLLFERGAGEATPTQVGARLVAQAQRVLDEVGLVKTIADASKDPLSGALRVGLIYTIAPYLLPSLVPALLAQAPQMPLMLQENFTVKLLEQLRQGEIDVAVLALPVSDSGLHVQAVYDEPFVVAVARKHAWAKRRHIDGDALAHENMLMLGAGHCFRDQVLDVCPEHGRMTASVGAMQRSFEGSSLETIRQMVASGIGITVLPQSAVPPGTHPLIAYVPFKAPAPSRRVALAWRKSFTRPQAIETLRAAIVRCALAGVMMLPKEKIIA